MALKDLPKFNAAEYAKQLEAQPTAELKKREIRKKRQQWSGFFSVTGGVVGAIHSCGGTFAVSALGACRWSIASQKLALVRAELRRREIELHKTEIKDIAIPFISYGVGAGIGLGLHEVAEVATNMDAPSCKWGFSSSAHSTLEAAIENPEDFADGVSSGIAENFNEMALAFQDIPDGILPGSESSKQTLIDHVTWHTAPSLEQAIGFKSGMSLAAVAEASTANYIASETAWHLVEACSPTTDATEGSKRLANRSDQPACTTCSTLFW